MRGMWIVGCVLFVAGVGGACGGDDKDYGAAISVSQDVKASAEDAVAGAAAVTLISTNPTSDSLGTFGNFFSDVSTIVDAKLAARGVKTAQLALHRALAAVPADSSCATVTATMVTLTNCASDGLTLNGSMTFSAGHFAFNVHIVGGADGLNLDMTESGSVDASKTAVAGSLSVGGSITGTTGGVSVNGNISYGTSIGVTLTDGCSVAGQLETHAVREIHGSGQGTSVNESTNIWAKAQFGPICHDVTVY
jgi:hypothetical protein